MLLIYPIGKQHFTLNQKIKKNKKISSIVDSKMKEQNKC